MEAFDFDEIDGKSSRNEVERLTLGEKLNSKTPVKSAIDRVVLILAS